MEIAGKVVVVTGASMGIGEAIALRLASMGATIVLTARDHARLAQVKAGIEEVLLVSAGSASDFDAAISRGTVVGDQVTRELFIFNAGFNDGANCIPI